MEPTGVMASLEIAPYSPEWWQLRLGNFTGSGVWKLMSEPKGKSPFEKYEDHINLLRKWENQFDENPKNELKSMQNLKVKIDNKKLLTQELHEHKNDCHISDTAETYILEKVHEKLTGKTKMGIDNASTQWGIEHEPLAKKWYCKITGNEIDGPYMKFHDTVLGYSCTPDGLMLLKTQEFKCPANGANHLKHWLISNDEYFRDKHDEYYYQCQSQMDIFNKDECDFVSFDPRIDNDRGMFIYSMKKDIEVVCIMHEKINVARDLFDGYYNLFSK